MTTLLVCKDPQFIGFDTLNTKGYRPGTCIKVQWPRMEGIDVQAKRDKKWTAMAGGSSGTLFELAKVVNMSLLNPQAASLAASLPIPIPSRAAQPCCLRFWPD